jgi:hypothetical protein
VKQSVSGSHPLAPQIKGLLRPDAGTTGLVHHLIDAAPSQKYMLKSRATIQIAGGSECIGIVSPCFPEEAVRPSAIFVVGTAANMAAAPMQNTQVGTGIATGLTATFVKPTRPYTSEDKAWRLVSYLMRVRYAGTALNASGNFKVLNNAHGEYRTVALSASRSWADLRNVVNSNLQTSLRAVHDRSIHDYASVGSTEWCGNQNYYPSDITADEESEEVTGDRIGQASSLTQIGEAGMIFTYANDAGSTLQIEVELFENWEVKGPSIAPFLTPSHNNPELHHEVMRTVFDSHLAAAKSSGAGDAVTNTVKFLSIANKDSKTPLGKAVIAACLA